MYVNPKTGKRKCRSCAAEREREFYEWRRKNQAFDVNNPDIDRAPIGHLWFHGPTLLAELLEDYTIESIRAIAPTKCDTMLKRIQEIQVGKRTWMRYESADRLCILLGFPVSALRIQPVYARSAHMLPKEVAA